MKICFVTLMSLTVLLTSSCTGQKGGTEKTEPKEYINNRYPILLQLHPSRPF